MLDVRHREANLDAFESGKGHDLARGCGFDFPPLQTLTLATIRLERLASTARDSIVGTRRLGRFELLGVVGSGSFGTVFRARDPELDRVVAIKVPRAGSLASGIGAYLSVRFLLRYLRTRTLTPFGVYCLIAGVGCVVYLGLAR